MLVRVQHHFNFVFRSLWHAASADVVDTDVIFANIELLSLFFKDVLPLLLDDFVLSVTEALSHCSFHLLWSHVHEAGLRPIFGVLQVIYHVRHYKVGDQVPMVPVAIEHAIDFDPSLTNCKEIVLVILPDLALLAEIMHMQLAQ